MVVGLGAFFERFTWLEVDSGKMALSRPAHQPSSGCYATGTPPRVCGAGRQPFGAIDNPDIMLHKGIRMPIEEHKAVVRRYFEEAPRNPEVCDEIFAPSFLFHTIQHASITAQVTESSPQSQKAAYAWLKAVWSAGCHMTIEEMIAEGDRVMVRWTFFGLHQGEFAGQLFRYQYFPPCRWQDRRDLGYL
jgi:hypothetical protein